MPDNTLFVDHEPNTASGGQFSRTDVGEFLARKGTGPEYQALMKLMSSFVDGRPA